MNLLSGLLDSATVGIVFLVVLHLAAHATAIRAASGPCGAAYVSADRRGAPVARVLDLFWAYSVVAEVFALDNLFAALLLLLGLEWCRRPDRGGCSGLSLFLFGLALCNQQTIALLVPGFLVLGLRSGCEAGAPGARCASRDLAAGAGAFARRPAPVPLPADRGVGGPADELGRPDEPRPLVADVSRAGYGSSSLTVSGSNGSCREEPEPALRRPRARLRLRRDRPRVLGLWWALRNRRGEGLALLVAFAVSGPVFVAATRTAFPGKLTKGIVARFYILPSIPLAIVAGLGAWWLLGRVESLGKPRPRRRRGGSAARRPGRLRCRVTTRREPERQRGRPRLRAGPARAASAGALLLMRGDEN